ncbi:MAG: hypothetical protein ACO1SV_08960 [Fimbriimonas sp.]
MKRNGLEWTVFGIGLALILAIVGYLGYEIATYRPDSPEVVVRLGRPARRGEVFVVPVTAINPSDETLEGVVLEATLTDGKGKETAQFEVAYLPRGSRREGWFTFSRNPGAGRLDARAIGFERP